MIYVLKIIYKKLCKIGGYYVVASSMNLKLNKVFWAFS
jgi:hypothetical protein